MKRTCTKCGIEHEWKQRGHGTLCGDCWKNYHREWRARNKSKIAAWSRETYEKLKADDLATLRIYQRKGNLRRNGVDPDLYEKKLVEQGGVCAICGEPEKAVNVRSGKISSLSVDHNHACCPGKKSCGKCIRGLLCFNCNSNLGVIESDFFPKAQEYLKLYENVPRGT